MAADAIQNILLEITGDSSEARDELLKTAKQIQQLDGEEADPKVDVDAEPAQRKLKDVFADLAQLAREKVTAKIGADTSDATTGMRMAAAQAEALDAKAVDVKVNADTSGFRGAFRGIATDIRATATNLTALLIPALIGVAGSLAPAVTVLASAGVALGALSVAVTGATLALGAFAAVAVSRFKKTVKDAGSAASELKAEAQSLNGVLGRAAATGVDKVFGALAGTLNLLKPAVGGLRGPFTALGGAIATAITSAGPGISALVTQFGNLMRATGPLMGPLVTIFVRLAAVILNVAQAAMPLLVAGAEAAVRKMDQFLGVTGDVDRMRGFIEKMADQLRLVADLGVAVARAIIPVFTALQSMGPGVVKDLTQIADRFADWASTAEGQKQIQTFFSQTFFAVRDLGKALAVAAPLAAGFMASFGGFQTLVLRGVTKFLEAVQELPAPLQAATLGISGLGAVGAQLLPGILMMTRLRNIEVALTGATNASSVAMVRQKVATLATAAATKVQVAATKVATAAQWLFNAAMAANPVGLIIIGIIALGAAFVLAYTKVKFFRDGVNAVWAWIKSNWPLLLAILTGPIGLAVALIIKHFDTLKSFVGGAVGAILGAARAAINAVLDALRAYVGAWLAVGKAYVNAVVDGVKAVAGALRAVVRGVIDAALAIVRGYVGLYRAAGTAVFNAVRNGIASVAGAIRAAASSILSAVLAIVRGFVDNARAAGAAVFNAVRNGIASVAGAVREAASSILSAVMSIVRGFVDNARSAGEAVFNAVRGGIASVAGEIASAARNAVNGAVSALRALAGAFEAAGRALMEAFGRGIIAAGQAVLDKISDIASKAKDLLPGSEPKDPTSPLRGLGKSGEAFVKNFAAGIARAAPALNAAVTDAVGGLAATASLSATGSVPAVNIPAMQQQAAGSPQYNFTGPWASGNGAQSDGFEAFARFAQIVRDRGGLG